jgi:predicted acylesterase/phospholipase RssA
MPKDSATHAPAKTVRPLTNEVPLSTVLVEEYEAQFGQLDPGVRSQILNPPREDGEPAGEGDAITPEGRRRAAFFKFVHERARSQNAGGPLRRSALCLSGGGIRSATFNLGILQRFARLGLLTKIDYLSTVSGGGYIGSWLSAWIYNQDHDVAKVQRDLSVVNDKPRAKDPADPEPDQVRMLRKYSRFLSPKGGFMSTDVWTLIAIYLRNLLLTWAVFLPLLAALVMLPRLGAALLAVAHHETWARSAGSGTVALGDTASRVLLGGTLACLGVGLGMALFAQTSLAVRLREISDGALPPLKSTRASWWWFGPAMLGCVLFAVVVVAPPIDPTLSNFQSTMWSGLGASVVMAAAFAIRLRRLWGPVPKPESEPAATKHDTTTRTAHHQPRTASPIPDPRRRFLLLGLFALLGGPATMVLVLEAIEHLPAVPVRVLAFAFGGVFVLFGLIPIVWSLIDTWPRRVLHVVAGVLAGVVAGQILRTTREMLSGMSPGAGAPGPETALWIAKVTTFAPPMAALALCAGGAVYVGFISRSKMAWDADREWWARAGALILRFAVVWTVVFGVVLFGPILLAGVSGWIRGATVSIGGFAGLVTVVLGASTKTPAAAGRVGAATASWADLASRYVLRLAAPTFIVLFFAALSLAMGAATLALAGLLRADSAVLDRGVALESLGGLPASGAIHLFFVGAALTFVLAVAVLVASTGINLTRFSLHGMYRDRLIRAYLGASSVNKDRDPFSDFDDRDNIFLGKIRLGALRVRDLAVDDSGHRRLYADVVKPDQAQDIDGAARDFLWYIRRMVVNARIALPEDPTDTPKAYLRDVVDQINAVIFHETLDGHGFDPQNLPERRRLNRSEVESNRTWLSEKLPGRFNPKHFRPAVSPQRPFHVVNTALNIVAGSNNAWQDRKAASMTFTPYHAGCAYLGYRDVREYGGPRGFSLGGAMTLSGAAVSPNQGYHSSPTIAFLLALFNVRLGAWCPNPGAAGEKDFRFNAPKVRGFLLPLMEALGRTNDTDPWVYLSDGGHFDNLGLYEMVQRRCHSIVVVDAGADPSCELFDLGNALRKIRVNLGIPIDLDTSLIGPKPGKIHHREHRDLRAEEKSKGSDSDPGITPELAGVAVGTIHYSVVDGPNAIPGKILYIKPSVTWNEPADVVNYARASKDFPHETTTDQWFTEPQFESYRQLGWHILKSVTSGDRSINDLDTLIEAVRIRIRGPSRGNAPERNPSGTTKSENPESATA